MRYVIYVLVFCSTLANTAFAEENLSKRGVVNKILAGRQQKNHLEQAFGNAPINIALAKYWGKRDKILHLPYHSSLSIALPYYSTTKIYRAKNVTKEDIVILNGQLVSKDREFYKRTVKFLDLFRPEKDFYFKIDTYNDLPTEAGLASSSSGITALVFALNEFFNWNLDKQNLSILARLGSGSATRSIYPGFVKWQKGEDKDGFDSYATKLTTPKWDELRIGVIVVSDSQKEVSSRNGMELSITTSPYYKAWVGKAEADTKKIEDAIKAKDINLLGKLMESNALAMHATAMTASPPIYYFAPKTLSLIKRLWILRKNNKCEAYFTIDAGPNLVLLFEQKDKKIIKEEFPEILIVKPLM